MKYVVNEEAQQHVCVIDDGEQPPYVIDGVYLDRIVKVLPDDDYLTVLLVATWNSEGEAPKTYAFPLHHIVTLYPVFGSENMKSRLFYKVTDYDHVMVNQGNRIQHKTYQSKNFAFRYIVRSKGRAEAKVYGVLTDIHDHPTDCDVSNLTSLTPMDEFTNQEGDT